jgi:hypothetical protein
MNKPLLIVLLVIAVGLVIYLATRGEVDTTPRPEESSVNKAEPYASCQGTKTDQAPEFDVQVAAIKSSGQNKIEFTVTELTGFCVQNVYVEVWHGVRNADTGEFDPPAAGAYKLSHLLKGVVPAGEPLVDSIVLNEKEMGELDWEEVESDGLVGRVTQWGDVFKPQ